MERAITITPLLQTERDYNPEDGSDSPAMHNFVRWGNDIDWSAIPHAWQPASDPEDEWAEAELTTGVV